MEGFIVIKKSMHEQKDGDSGDDAVDSDGFPRWMLSAIGSSSKAVSSLATRRQRVRLSGDRGGDSSTRLQLVLL